MLRTASLLLLCTALLSTKAQLGGSKVGGYSTVEDFDVHEGGLSSALQCFSEQYLADAKTVHDHLHPVLDHVAKVETQVVSGVNYRLLANFTWLMDCREAAEEAKALIEEEDGDAQKTTPVSLDQAIDVVCRTKKIQLPETYTQVQAIVWHQAWQDPPCRSIKYNIVSGPSAADAHAAFVDYMTASITAAMHGEIPSSGSDIYPDSSSHHHSHSDQDHHHHHHEEEEDDDDDDDDFDDHDRFNIHAWMPFLLILSAAVGLLVVAVTLITVRRMLVSSRSAGTGATAFGRPVVSDKKATYTPTTSWYNQGVYEGELSDSYETSDKQPLTSRS